VIVVLIFLLLFGWQIPGCVMAHMPKTGRIVDAATGAGLDHVAVIASAHFRADNLIHGSNTSCRYRVVVQTDPDGRFWVPSTWTHLAFGLPGTDPYVAHEIAVYKAGYVVDGDERAWTFNEYGQPGSPGSELSEVWLGPVIRVQTIKMKPASGLSLKQEAVYYRNSIIGSFYGCDVNRGSPEEVALRKSAYQVLLPRACATPTDEGPDDLATYSLIDLTPQRDKAGQRLKELEPENWGKDSYALPRFKAGRVCEAMKAGGGPP
jgi:hypothetical protein